MSFHVPWGTLSHLVLVMLTCAGVPPVCALAQPFVEVSEAAGIDYMQHVPNIPGFCLLPGEKDFCESERMSGAAAVADYNRDGWPDLYVTRMDLDDILYRNNGDGTFTDVTAEAGLAFRSKTNGAWWADFDRDGRLDLLLTSIGDFQNYLFMNRGDGTFYEDAEARGAALNEGKFHMSYSPAVGDYNNDGYLDIFTVEWGIGFFTGNSFTPRVRLLRNRGAAAPGFFEDVTATAGTTLRTNPPSIGRAVFGFGAAFVDLDTDGHLDLAVAADFETSTLLWNNGDGTFTDGTVAANVGTDENGMGSTFGDYDGDGDLDWFVTSIFDPDETCEGSPCNWGYTGNRLYRYDGNRTFTDVTTATGVRDGGWGWGTAFYDPDNDGDLDLVMTNGANFPGNLPVLANFVQDPMRAWANDGMGNMTEAAAAQGLTDTRSGKGLVTLDYDADGDLDLYIVNNASTPVLYRNDQANGNHWLRVAVEGPVNCDFEGLNARIAVTAGGKTQIRDMGVATHYLGQSERVAHFGLGPAESVDTLTVTWPRTGETQTFTDLAADQNYVVVPPASLTSVLDRTHAADTDADDRIDFGELLRTIQLYNASEYHLADGTEDGFAPGPGDRDGARHTADRQTPNWTLELTELLRVIQLFNSGEFVRDCNGEDGFVLAGI